MPLEQWGGGSQWSQLNAGELLTPLVLFYTLKSYIIVKHQQHYVIYKKYTHIGNLQLFGQCWPVMVHQYMELWTQLYPRATKY